MINNGDWIYFYGDDRSPSKAKTFAYELVCVHAATDSGLMSSYHTLRPLTSTKPISALTSFGDMDVKGDGFRVLCTIVRDSCDSGQVLW